MVVVCPRPAGRLRVLLLAQHLGQALAGFEARGDGPPVAGNHHHPYSLDVERRYPLPRVRTYMVLLSQPDSSLLRMGSFIHGPVTLSAAASATSTTSGRTNGTVSTEAQRRRGRGALPALQRATAPGGGEVHDVRRRPAPTPRDDCRRRLSGRDESAPEWVTGSLRGAGARNRLARDPLASATKVRGAGRSSGRRQALTRCARSPQEGR
jgi:hypothetical protein